MESCDLDARQVLLFLGTGAALGRLGIRALVYALGAIYAAPDAVGIYASVEVRGLIAPEAVVPLLYNLAAVDHDVDLLRVVPRLRVLVAAADDGHLVVELRILDVTVALLAHRIERTRHVLARVPC